MRRVRARARYLAAAAAATVGFGLALGVSVLEAGAASTSPPAITGGQTLTSGSTLASSNGQYQAVFNNGVLSDRITAGRTLWKVGASTPGAYAVLQPNGMLVIFDPTGQVIWASGATGSGCPALNMQRDGNLVDYDPAAIWASASVEHGMVGGDDLHTDWTLYPSGYEYQLGMQSDGNLVIRNNSDKAIWQSETSGNPGAYAAMQTDGNFVVYSAKHKVLWSTGTSSNPGATLVFGSDGNLAVESAAGKALWSSGSAGKAGTGSAFSMYSVKPSATPCPTTVAPPTTTVVETQTETDTVTTTQTVVVPTTTILTVAAPAPTHKLKRFDIRMETRWAFVGDRSYLRDVVVGKLLSGVAVTATYNPHLKHHHSTTWRAKDRRTLSTLIRHIRAITYRPGQTLYVNLTRKGYEHEWATFTIRSGKLPTIRPAAPRRR